MRFSLSTLILVVLFCGCAGLVWVSREPWYVESVASNGDFNDLNAATGLSPDRTRFVLGRNEPDSRLTIYAQGWPIYWVSPGKIGDRWFDNAGFLNDDTIVGLTFNKRREVECLTLKRRFPEWWWGHFYRPEVWAQIVLGGILLWNVVSQRRLRQANA